MTSPKNIEEIDNFINRVKVARQTRSKEIRLTLVEAENLALSLTALISRDLTLAEKIVQLQQQLLDMKMPSSSDPSMDGGKF